MRNIMELAGLWCDIRLVGGNSHPAFVALQAAVTELEAENARIRADIERYVKIASEQEAKLAELAGQEPVAWIEHHKAGDNLNWERVDHPYAKASPLGYLAVGTREQA